MKHQPIARQPVQNQLARPASTFDPLDGLAETYDKLAMASIARATSALSPATFLQSFTDWALHLSVAPGKQMQLAAKAMRKAARLGDYALRRFGDADAEPAIEPLPQDRRFRDPAWQEYPFDMISQAFLLNQQWWDSATTGIQGMTRHHSDVMRFAVRQFLDIFAPTNFIATNPLLQKRIADTGGMCLFDGAAHLLEDMQRHFRGEPPVGAEDFPVGEKVAITPGKVVYRNRLIELIQYAPTTDKVRPEPIMIVPAWIMKYYILDLSPHNSLVRWLTDQGYTVFILSWHNPDSADRDLDMADYCRMGPMEALDKIVEITGSERVHGVGYCIGGTLLAIVAAALAQDGDTRLASLTFFAAQTEFSEPGELGLFIDDAQLALLESMMWSRGYLDGGQMGGAFQMLRSNDLVWSRILGTYLMGERPPMNDLMAWNADGTRMPYAMHSQYLRQLFLHDDLAEGRFRLEGQTVSLTALRQPMFVVGTERDHVAPWRSVHKIHMLTGAPIRFLLTSGGHNAGIISEPGGKRRRFRVLDRPIDGAVYAPDEWLCHAEMFEGSWWTAWGEWLDEQSGEPVDPPPLGLGGQYLYDAPGYYVHER
ncbi:MAG: alpha/beta fold hydrolase [Sphingomonadaceae bacterium]